MCEKCTLQILINLINGVYHKILSCKRTCKNNIIYTQLNNILNKEYIIKLSQILRQLLNKIKLLYPKMKL